MKTSVNRMLMLVFTALAAGMVILSGIGKLTGQPPVVETLTNMGVAAYLIPLGLLEIGFTLLYLLPATRKIGFLLLTAYFSGALATELSHGSALVAAVFLVVIWISAFLRDRSIFLTAESVEKTRQVELRGVK
ncbi:DoxX family protein [Spirosoma arcticum]